MGIRMDEEKNQCYQQKQDISLLFLDVDGVLNTSDPDKVKKSKSVLSMLRPQVERLKEIITSSNIECKICVSSAWRLCEYALLHLKKTLITMADIDVDRVIVGKTPSIPFNDDIDSYTEQRIHEIKSYLNDDKTLNSKFNVISFVVVDDLDLSGIGMNNFVHINPKYGLTETKSLEILSKLNSGNKQKLIELKSKPRIKLLFIAGLENNYNNINSERLQIILKKTECTLVLTKHEYNHKAYHDSFTIDNFTEITQYVTNLEQTYNIESWAVLDYINIHQQYAHFQAIITRRFVKVDPNTQLELNHVLATISILNKWS